MPVSGQIGAVDTRSAFQNWPPFSWPGRNATASRHSRRLQTQIRTRQSLVSPGLWDKLRSRFQKTPNDPDWRLPDGQAAEPIRTTPNEPAARLERVPRPRPWTRRSFKPPGPTAKASCDSQRIYLEGVEADRSTNRPANVETRRADGCGEIVRPAALAIAQARVIGSDRLGVLAVRGTCRAARCSKRPCRSSANSDFGRAKPTSWAILAWHSRHASRSKPRRCFGQRLNTPARLPICWSKSLALDRLAMCYANLGRPDNALNLAARAIALAQAASGDRLRGDCSDAGIELAELRRASRRLPPPSRPSR